MSKTITSVELCAKYGARTTYKNAARTAKRLVKRHNLPYRLVGYRWVELEGRKAA